MSSASGGGQPAATGGGQPGVASSGGSSSCGSSNGGLITLVIIGAIVLAACGVIFIRYMRRSLRASHRRREESADAGEQASTEFGQLGDEIGALDIDSSMPGASAEGKDEYAKALECYQDAERRLGKSGDDYQFERAVAAIQQGLEHVGNADKLFNGARGTKS